MSGSGSVLPPDIKKQMERSAGRTGGIGSAIPENSTAARARDHAMNPDAVDEEERSAVVVAKEEDLKVCPNPRCAKNLITDWNFCAHCGSDLLRAGQAARLGITWTESDIHDYLFKGYVVKNIKILGNHEITLKSSQPQDAAAIDHYLMNGAWAKDEKGADRKISEFYLRQVNSLCVTASSLVKFDGNSIGDSLEARIKWLNERGSALVDMMSNKVVLFNQALTKHLEQAETISGS
jgi:hypothetical protein